MATGRLEHANISVTDPERSAALLKDLLGWEEGWRGPSQIYGRSVHIGAEHDYIALYTGDHVRGEFAKGHPLNHIAFTVDDLDAAEKAVTAHGLTPFGHDDYVPGRRFYFFDWDGIEFEVVSYE
ncbi:VOC family protein [Qipengyuania sp. Mu-71]|jgi:catechol 2,3-dioxygenase-like lactoylglutathione lyase family enzyme|uniref:VOC family protein n=1 Tax=Qipengyuania sp. Mu-71 TaxID=3121477 RepID=UPI002FE45344